MDTHHTQTSIAKHRFRDGDFEGALRIMHTWTRGLSEQDRNILQTAWNCMQSPEIYSQMGYDCEYQIQLANECISRYFKEA